MSVRFEEKDMMGLQQRNLRGLRRCIDPIFFESDFKKLLTIEDKVALLIRYFL
jgi:hypothetical protein